MTNKEILQIAMEQSAKDIGCKSEDFLKSENIVVPFNLGADAKKYYKLPIDCNFISYGNNIVASATDKCMETVKEYVNKFEFYHCFETPNMRWLNERIKMADRLENHPTSYPPEELLSDREICFRSHQIMSRFKFVHYYDEEIDTVFIVDIWDMKMNPKTLIKRIK